MGGQRGGNEHPLWPESSENEPEKLGRAVAEKDVLRPDLLFSGYVASQMAGVGVREPADRLEGGPHGILRLVRGSDGVRQKGKIEDLPNGYLLLLNVVVDLHIHNWTVSGRRVSREKQIRKRTSVKWKERVVRITSS